MTIYIGSPIPSNIIKSLTLYLIKDTLDFLSHTTAQATQYADIFEVVNEHK